jgi:large subunit ribosomal protein L33
MAKKTSVVIVVLQAADGGQDYTTTKNRRNTEGKLKLKKYNPRTRQHEVYTEAKIKKGK